MTNTALAVAWYRFRATFRRRWSGYVTVAVLIGLVGGVAMGSIAAARRTQSSYPTFLAGTHPSDVTVTIYDPATDGGAGPPLTSTFAHLADVKRVTSIVTPNFVPLTAQGAPRLQTLNLVVDLGSLDGEFSTQDRLTALSGRLADPKRADEIMMTASAAQLLGVHLGQLVPLGFYVPSQLNLPGFGTAKVTPRILVRAKVVGIVTANNQVVQDDIDRAYGFIVVSPALIEKAAALSTSAVSPEAYAFQLYDGARDVVAVQHEIIRSIPPQLTYEFHVNSRVVTEVELAVKPESIALGAFGAIAALVALVLAVQAISRQLRLGEVDRRVLRALGLDPLASAGDGLIGLLAAVVIGALLAAVVAVGLSPLSPVGPIRPVYPDRGIAFDWTVLGIGVPVLIGVLCGAAVALAYRELLNERLEARRR